MPSFLQTLSPTPFGQFDSDASFQRDADAMVTYVRRKLGDDILSVELTRKQIWACFEEGVMEYGRLINEFRIESDLINVLGLPTGSTDMTSIYPRQTLEFLLRQADAYATEAFLGGSYDPTLGYIQLVGGQQDYDLYTDLKDASTNLVVHDSLPTGSRGKMRVIEVFHFEPFAAQTFLLNASNMTNFLASNFNYESYVNSSIFYVLPIFEDVMRRSVLEAAFRVRRSNYSWQIQGSKLRIYPIPISNVQLGNLYVQVYSGPLNPADPTAIPHDDTLTGVNSPANAPFYDLPYSSITQPGKQWIRQYTLALCKELLGLIRSKIKTIPIPNADLTLNGEDLVSQGREDKEKLKDQLREWLAKLTNKALMEQEADLAEAMQKALRFTAMPRGKSIVIG